MTIKCISIDDEPLALKGIKLALQNHSELTLTSQYGAADEFLQDIANGNIAQPDVLFVDIEMPRMNGFELIAQYPGPLPIVVFVTAYDQYAVQAFEQQALDYILKPIEESRFKQVVDRIKHVMNRPKENNNADELLKKIAILKQQVKLDVATLSIKTDSGYFRVKIPDILLVESVGDHVCIYLKDRQLITRSTLKYYISALDEHGFKQVHKSNLVNLKEVVQLSKLRFSDYQLIMTNGKQVRVSRRYKSAISSFLQ